MKKVYVALSLLMLLLVQQGAVLHELSHVGQLAAHSDVRVESGSFSSTKICELCIAYAQLTYPAAHALPVSLVIPAMSELSPEPDYHVVATEVPTPRSRGPPSLS